MKLVESMHKNDLALRGKIDTAELLVFPSNILPEYSQSKNKHILVFSVASYFSINHLKLFCAIF